MKGSPNRALYKRLSEWLFKTLVLGAATITADVHAQTPPNCPIGEGAPPKAETLSEYETWLAAQAARCDHNAAYQAWYGAILNQLGRHAEAIDKLEYALMLDSRLMGARLDYADALAATGQTEAARQLLQQVLAQPDIPPAIAATIQSALVRSTTANENPWRHKGSITALLGYDNNLNRATRAGELSLTLPDGDILLPLDPQSQAQSGASMLIEMSDHARRNINESQYLHFNGELRQRSSPEIPTYDYTQLDAALHWGFPAQDTESRYGIGGGMLQISGDRIYQYLRASTARNWQQTTGSLINLDAAIENRHFPENAPLDHQYWQTQITWLRGKAQNQKVQLELGREHGDSNRPGGNAWRTSVNFSNNATLGPGRLISELRYSSRRNDSSLSPLLSNGARLKLDTLDMKLEYQQNITEHWQSIANIQLTDQQSNIELYDHHALAAYLGLMWSW